jgi:hypothetical protein
MIYPVFHHLVRSLMISLQYNSPLSLSRVLDINILAIKGIPDLGIAYIHIRKAGPAINQGHPYTMYYSGLPHGMNFARAGLSMTPQSTFL